MMINDVMCSFFMLVCSYYFMSINTESYMSLSFVKDRTTHISINNHMDSPSAQMSYLIPNIDLTSKPDLDPPPLPAMELFPAVDLDWKLMFT